MDYNPPRRNNQDSSTSYSKDSNGAGSLAPRSTPSAPPLRESHSAEGGKTYSRPPSRFDSPPLSIPLRTSLSANSPTSSNSYSTPPSNTYSIPLRPSAPSRYQPHSPPTPAVYWRPGSSADAALAVGGTTGGSTGGALPMRPTQRYRSPPLGGERDREWESLSRDSRPRERERERERSAGTSRWDRDSYSRSSDSLLDRIGGHHRGRSEDWDRERERERRLAILDGPLGAGPRRFEVPYRVNPRKRSRESSEDGGEREDFAPRTTGRGGRISSPDWRDREVRRSSEGFKPYLLKREREEQRPRGPPSLPGSDSPSTFDLPPRPRNRSRSRERFRRARSYSPGEVSDSRPYYERERTPPPPLPNLELMREKEREWEKEKQNAREMAEQAIATDKEEGEVTSSAPSPLRPSPTAALEVSSVATSTVVNGNLSTPPSPQNSPPSPATSSELVPRADYQTQKVEEPVASNAVDAVIEAAHSALGSGNGDDDVTLRVEGAETMEPAVEVSTEVQSGDEAATLVDREEGEQVETSTEQLPSSTTMAATQVVPELGTQLLSESALPTTDLNAIDDPASESTPPTSVNSTLTSSFIPPAPLSDDSALLVTVLSSTANDVSHSALPDLPPTDVSKGEGEKKEETTSFIASVSQLQEILAPHLDESGAFIAPDVSGDVAMEVVETMVEATGAPTLMEVEEQLEVKPLPVELGVEMEVEELDVRPVTPPRDFSAILGTIIAFNEEDSGDVNALMEHNRAMTEKERESMANLKFRSEEVLKREFAAVSMEDHDRLRPFLFGEFTERDEKRGQKALELRTEYKALHDDWRAHCKRLDKIKDRIHRRNLPTATVPTTPSIDPSSGLPFYPEPVTPGGASITGGRANRRNANYGDAVRSEAEFLEILASLETADMRDPNVRATRTAAIVPDMVIDKSERQQLLEVILEDDRRIVEDPVEFYGVQAPMDLWTEDEVQIFCKRYSQHPKQFGKIAADLPDKSTAQCVLFYYRMKTTIDFRSLSDRRGRDGRRKKQRRRVDADGKAKKGGFLLSNLKRSRADDRDDDEDSPPPSPNGTRPRPLFSETPSVFQPPGTSLRPEATADDSNDDGPSGRGKKTRTPKLRAALLPSDGMLEAAETLGALGGALSGEGDADDDAIGKGKKRRVRMDVDGDASETKEKDKAAARRKSASSSYWSVAERNEFIRLLGVHGKDWQRLAAGLENKTAVQCRNWFQNHSKKLNLADIAKGAGVNFDEDGDDDTTSGPATPGGDFTVPIGVPLSESLGGVNGNALPRAGFFTSSDAQRLPRLPSIDMPAFDEKFPKAGMQIRNLLNDDTPDEEVPPPAREDWFGASGDAGSVTTEDESDAPKQSTAARSPSRHSEPTYPRQQDPYPHTYQDEHHYSSRGYKAPTYHHPPPPTYASSYSAPPDHRYDSGRSPLPNIGHWQSTPPSPYPPYGPPSGADAYYNRPVDRQGSYPPPPPPQHAPRDYFPTTHSFDRYPPNFQPPPPPSSYPPPANSPWNR